jgi:DNA primase
MDNWVDFKAVKQAVTIEQVVAYYGLQLRKSGPGTLRGRCPLPSHSSKDSSVSFSINTTKNVWSCLSDSCKKARRGSAGGNTLDLVAAIEDCSVRDAALKLATWFNIASAPSAEATVPHASPRPRAPEKEQLAAREKEVGENKPLSFTLQGVRYCEYLCSRGITEETATTFGVGLFPGRGTMAGRVVIPIHNERGELVAYAGRSVEGAEPKYKLPAGFHKSHVLYNLHRAEGGEVIVVEGFFDCMKMFQAGLPAVALMGSSLSHAQEELLLGRFAHVTLLLDGDDAGRNAADEIAKRIIRRLFVRVLELPDGKQPDMLHEEELKTLFSS